jgi:hypothetical protein
MVKPLLEQLRSKVEQASGLTDSTKAELLKLVADLENQANRTRIQNAKDAAAAAPGSTESRDHLERLVASVDGLEASHPEITALVNRIATTLGNMGI